MSLRNGEACTRCNGTAIGQFPHVGLGVGTPDGAMTVDGLDMTLYTCAECGFSELYMQRPLRAWKQTPAEQDMAFEWVRPPSDTPFR